MSSCGPEVGKICEDNQSSNVVVSSDTCISAESMTAVIETEFLRIESFNPKIDKGELCVELRYDGCPTETCLLSFPKKESRVAKK